MRFVVLSGLSGAGRTTALAALEDLGYFTADNVPPALWDGLVAQADPVQPRVAVGVGARGGAGAGAPQRQLTGEKATGTVKFFNAMKGFGFIQRDDGQPDAFVHISAVERAGMPTLNEGDRLEFEIEVDRRGKYAAVNLSSSS